MTQPAAPTSVVARPRATAIMSITLAIVLTTVMLGAWAMLGPEVLARVTWYQAVTLVVFLAFSDGFLLAIALSYVRADATGLTFRNLVGTRHLDWAEIDHLRFADGDPFAYAYLRADHPSGRERQQLLGIQQTDGERGRELFARVAAQRPA